MPVALRFRYKLISQVGIHSVRFLYFSNIRGGFLRYLYEAAKATTDVSGEWAYSIQSILPFAYPSKWPRQSQKSWRGVRGVAIASPLPIDDHPHSPPTPPRTHTVYNLWPLDPGSTSCAYNYRRSIFERRGGRRLRSVGLIPWRVTPCCRCRRVLGWRKKRPSAGDVDLQGVFVCFRGSSLHLSRTWIRVGISQGIRNGG